MLVDDGIILLKYWFSVSEKEQAKRFEARIDDPLKQWKLSPTDLYSRSHWVDYSRAKDEMFKYTDTKDSPWWVVDSNDKKRARLNAISHLLSVIPYRDVMPPAMILRPRKPASKGYMRVPIDSQTFLLHGRGADLVNVAGHSGHA